MEAKLNLGTPRENNQIFRAAFRFLFREGGQLTTFGLVFHLAILCFWIAFLFALFSLLVFYFNFQIEDNNGDFLPELDLFFEIIGYLYLFSVLYAIHVLTQLFIRRYQDHLTEETEQPTLWQLAKKAPAIFWFLPVLNLFAFSIGTILLVFPGIAAAWYFQFASTLALQNRFRWKTPAQYVGTYWRNQLLLMASIAGWMVLLTIAGVFLYLMLELVAAEAKFILRRNNHIGYSDFFEISIAIFITVSAQLAWQYFTLVKSIYALQLIEQTDPYEPDLTRTIGLHLAETKNVGS